MSLRLERLALLERIRVCGNAMADKLHETAGGDAMNAVEAFREAEADYARFMYVFGVQLEDDDETE